MDLFLVGSPSARVTLSFGCRAAPTVTDVLLRRRAHPRSMLRLHDPLDFHHARGFLSTAARRGSRPEGAELNNVGGKLQPNFPCVKTRYGQIRFFENDDPIGRSLTRYGEWAEHEIQLLSAFIGLGSKVVDIGANIGTHTIAFARRVGPTGCVIAFEPQQRVFEVLESNVMELGLANVRAVHAGVGAAAGKMMVPPVDYVGHTNLGGVRLLPVADNRAGEITTIVTLDSYNLEACHLIKVDAEGMETDVVLGMATTLETMRPVVACECNTVTNGVEILRANKWRDYAKFLYRVAAFNPYNLRKNGENFFGVANESGLLFVPNECIHLVREPRLGIVLIEISDLDSLATAILETPRYGDRTIKDRSPAQLREAIAQIEHENMEQVCSLDARIRTAQEELQAAREAAACNVVDLQKQLEAVREAAARDVARLEFRAASLSQQLRRAEDRVATALAAAAAQEQERIQVLTAQEQTRSDFLKVHDADLQLIVARDQEIKALRESTSWRVTAPLRWVKMTLTAVKQTFA